MVTRHTDRFSSHESEVGFAMLEAVVAVAVCALVLTVYLRVIGQGAEATHQSKERLAAIAFAQSKFSELYAAPRLDPGLQTGALTDTGTWTLTITPSLVPPGPVALFDARLDIDIGRRRQPQHLGFAARILKPSRADAHAQ